ncbi:hypothetical protein BC936DRAFT_140749 [Jimgerdemannia flammicorona]|uniref:Uncharacterized protein n=1 Tax=Jimgerdemannia flammicorona TaxID=994334 RepID=A0A433DGL7_9FUNG|nr:hypothetical protein BC936DRAFT_140749 [Jimgerdemannia flammicorona]
MGRTTLKTHMFHIKSVSVHSGYAIIRNDERYLALRKQFRGSYSALNVSYVSSNQVAGTYMPRLEEITRILTQRFNASR